MNAPHQRQIHLKNDDLLTWKIKGSVSIEASSNVISITHGLVCIFKNSL